MVTQINQTDSTIRLVVNGEVNTKSLPAVQTGCVLRVRCTTHGSTSKHKVIQLGSTIVSYATVHLADPAVLGSTFSEESYAHASSALFVGTASTNSLWVVKDPNVCQTFVNTVRTWIISRYQKLFQPHISAILMGIVVGNTDYIQKEDQQVYRITGTAHMFSVSGAHVGVVFMVFFAILGRFKTHNFSRILTAVLIVLYVMISGSTSPAVRAAVMGLLYLFAQYKEIQFSALNCLGTTILLQLLVNPVLLLHISFIMSVCAMAGLLIVTPLWLQLFERCTIYPSSVLQFVQSGAATSMGASLGITVPVAVVFQTISLFGIIANLIVVPILSAVLIGALLVLILPTDSLVWCIARAVECTHWFCNAVAALSPSTFTSEQLWGIVLFSLILWIWPLFCNQMLHVVTRSCIVICCGCIWWFGVNVPKLTVSYTNVRNKHNFELNTSQHSVRLAVEPSGAINGTHLKHE